MHLTGGQSGGIYRGKEKIQRGKEDQNMLQIEMDRKMIDR
jgi:hypothetical protein